jgi:hypothetical protein
VVLVDKSTVDEFNSKRLRAGKWLPELVFHVGDHNVTSIRHHTNAANEKMDIISLMIKSSVLKHPVRGFPKPGLAIDESRLFLYNENYNFTDFTGIIGDNKLILRNSFLKGGPRG